jgi:hypothetical protein
MGQTAKTYNKQQQAKHTEQITLEQRLTTHLGGP